MFSDVRIFVLKKPLKGLISFFCKFNYSDLIAEKNKIKYRAKARVNGVLNDTRLYKKIDKMW
jgi:hypothetical protein